MKVTTAHRTALAEAIALFDKPEHRERYAKGDFVRADKVQDVDMRYRWDLYWAAGGYRILGWDPAGYTTDHIDTALRSIVPALTTQGKD